METVQNDIKEGLKDGLPIGLGYLATSFAFGILSNSLGLTLLEAVLISMTNLTSAGQLAAAPIIAAGG
ncbi:MAG: AzlC family ABC transporter permease, partial [Clostridia bacterium]|nr:AzlC family ABC transporter permease [Clostridia bacterium]